MSIQGSGVCVVGSWSASGAACLKTCVLNSGDLKQRGPLHNIIIIAGRLLPAL